MVEGNRAVVADPVWHVSKKSAAVFCWIGILLQCGCFLPDAFTTMKVDHKCKFSAFLRFCIESLIYLPFWYVGEVKSFWSAETSDP